MFCFQALFIWKWGKFLFNPSELDQKSDEHCKQNIKSQVTAFIKEPEERIWKMHFSSSKVTDFKLKCPRHMWVRGCKKQFSSLFYTTALYGSSVKSQASNSSIILVLVCCGSDSASFKIDREVTELCIHRRFSVEIPFFLITKNENWKFTCVSAFMESCCEFDETNFFWFDWNSHTQHQNPFMFDRIERKAHRDGCCYRWILIIQRRGMK